jgi:Major tropism determinant N-terminal domain
MALQLRRGTNTNRLTITPAQGEPIYNTDTKTLYIGDGVTAGGNAVSPVTNVNGLTGNVSLTTDTVGEGSHNQYFTSTRAIDSVGVALAAGTLSGLAISYNSTSHTITITNTNSIASGTGGAIAYYASAGTALSASESIVWSEAGNNLNINNGNYSIINNYSGAQMLTYSTYATNALSNSVAFRRARNTNVTPQVVLIGDQIQSLNFQGFDGSSFITASQITANVATTVSTGIVPGDVRLFTADPSTGTLYPRLTSNYNGVIIGPSTSADLGSGSLYIHQTVTSSTTSTAQVNNYYTDAYGAGISLRKYRGTYASPTVVLQNDVLGSISARGFDGTSSTLAGRIDIVADSTISTGVVPGAIQFSTANSSGTNTLALKIDHTQVSTFSSNVVVNGNLTVNGTTVTVNSNTLNVEDKVINLAYTPAGVVSATGTVGTITGTGPWTATITGMTSTAGLNVGEAITATAGTGTLYGGSPSSCLVASIVSSTSITYTVTGGTIPTAGTITNITGGGPTDTTASGSGVLVYGTSNKSITWTSSATTGGSNTGYWNSTDNLNLNGSSLGYYINGTSALTSSTILSGASSITVGAAGVTEYLGANTGNSTLSIYGNGTSGTATITSNVTTGTANLFAGVTGSINLGGITWAGANNSALIVNNGGLQFSSASAVAAAGSNQGTATQLYADNNFVTSGTGGVILPAATLGREVSVTNNTGASINVYPQGTHTIESGSAGVPTVLPNLATISLMAKSGNNWWTIQPVYNAGTNIAITQSANGTVTWATSANPSFTNITRNGLEIAPANYITVNSSTTYALSTTVTDNILLVSSTGYTATLTFPGSPVDGQRLRFSVQTNTVTLALTAGPTLSGTFAGSVTAPTTFTYIYRTSNTTWYRIQ